MCILQQFPSFLHDGDSNKCIKLNFASQRGSAHQGWVSGRDHLFAFFSWDTQVGSTLSLQSVEPCKVIFKNQITNYRPQIGDSDLASCWCRPRGCRNPSHPASCCQDWQGQEKENQSSFEGEVFIRAKGTRTWSLCQTLRTGGKYSKFVQIQGMFLWLTGLLSIISPCFSYWKRKPIQHVGAGHQTWWHR